MRARSDALLRDAAMPETVRVWDLGVRIFHWALVLAVSAALLTGFILGPTTLTWHLVAGVTVMVMLGWRLVWGLLGPAYVRFRNFAYGPRAVLHHLRVDLPDRTRRHLGHNPLGATMVFALLAVLAALGLSGVVVLGGLLKQGPLRAFLLYRTGVQALSLHQAIAILLLVMIGAHLLGVAFESWRARENLVGAMVTGRKLAGAVADRVCAAETHAVWALSITLLVLLGSAVGVAALARLPGRLVPSADLDPVFAEQCGACHLPYPPSLAPASTWQGLLADLQHHFTADATLSDDQVAHLRDWLVANDATHWDTLPSHLLRVPAADGSLRISDAPGWRRRHRSIPDAVFTTPPVRHRSNCGACHADAASGLFAPQNIAIPAPDAP